jgi:hypothetical protein
LRFVLTEDLLARDPDSLLWSDDVYYRLEDLFPVGFFPACLD